MDVGGACAAGIYNIFLGTSGIIAACMAICRAAAIFNIFVGGRGILASCIATLAAAIFNIFVGG